MAMTFVAPFLARAANLDTTFANPGYVPPTDASGAVNIGLYIQQVYNFAVGISGILAVGLIAVGGIMYAISGGRPDRQNEGKEMIIGALWGLVLLFGSYFILKTINPQIVALNTPGGTGFATALAPSATTTTTSPCGNISCAAHTYLNQGTSFLLPTCGQLGINDCTVNVVLGVTAHAQYNNTEIWQAAYYPSRGGTAQCVVYAYRDPGESVTMMTPSMSGLALCP